MPWGDGGVWGEGSYVQDRGFNDFKFDHGYLYIDVSDVGHRLAPVPTRANEIITQS